MNKSFQYIVKGLETRNDPINTAKQFYFKLCSKTGKFIDPLIYEAD